MAAATPELKARFKELGIFNGTWTPVPSLPRNDAALRKFGYLLLD